MPVASQQGSMSPVGLGVGLGSLAHRVWHFSSTAVGAPQLRQNYITPHCIKCWSSHSQAHFVALHRWRALRVYAAGVMQNCLRWSGHQPPALPGRLRALRAVVCCPSGMLALWLMSGALRMVLVSGLAVHLVFAPAHPWACLLRSIACAVCPSAPQGGSLRTAPMYA